MTFKEHDLIIVQDITNGNKREVAQICDEDGNCMTLGSEFPDINNWGKEDDRPDYLIIATVDLDNLTINKIENPPNLASIKVEKS